MDLWSKFQLHLELLKRNIWSRGWRWGHACSLQVHLEISQQANSLNYFLWTWWSQSASRNTSRDIVLYKPIGKRTAASRRCLMWNPTIQLSIRSVLPLSWIWRACDLCIPGALPGLGSKLRSVNTGRKQLSFCNSWTSSPLSSLHHQTIKRKNDSSVRGYNFFSDPWMVTTNKALWGLPMGSVWVAQSTGTQLFPSLQLTKGHRVITATSSSISLTSMVKTLLPVWFVS